ncbi:hypothetical protein RFI_28708, partial [Reticulomyxa filosa]
LHNESKSGNIIVELLLKKPNISIIEAALQRTHTSFLKYIYLFVMNKKKIKKKTKMAEILVIGSASSLATKINKDFKKEDCENINSKTKDTNNDDNDICNVICCSLHDKIINFGYRK